MQVWGEMLTTVRSIKSIQCQEILHYAADQNSSFVNITEIGTWIIGKRYRHTDSDFKNTEVQIRFIQSKGDQVRKGR